MLLENLSNNRVETLSIFTKEKDREHVTWCYLQMLQFPISKRNYIEYERHIVGIMRELPNDEMFPFLFVLWCRLVIQKTGLDEETQLLFINITSDMLYLPRAAMFHEDPRFIRELSTNLIRVTDTLRRNATLAADLNMEIAMSTARYVAAKTACMNAIKEELIATAMHPTRIERLINDHGMDVLESI